LSNYRKWKGIAVDKGLKDEWLEKVNSVPRTKVISTCEGHRGGHKAHFNLVVRGTNAEKRAMNLKKKLSGPNTKADVLTEHGDIVTRVNGKVRAKYKEYDHGRPTKVVLTVENKGRKSPSWWNNVLKKL
jgi:hypothetical protein